MAAKTTLRHKTASGRIDTRTTARDYTHVTIAYGYTEKYEAARFGTDDDGRPLKTFADEYGEGTEIVLSWHGSEPAARKKAAGARENRVWKLKVEAINGGERRLDPSDDGMVREIAITEAEKRLSSS